jgi:cytochrome c oxidase subunit II
VKIEKLEKLFMIIGGLVLAAAAVALVLSVTQEHATLPQPAGRIHPDDVVTTPPFDQPGLRHLGGNQYEAVIVARAWSWDGGTFTVPAGSEVKLISTSVDVIHGIRIPDTNVNVMIIPGQISEVDVTFDEPGTYSLICHEYCGIGHHGMGGLVTVE